MPLTLIDTSSWVEALRRQGSEVVRDRVHKLLVEGQAAWCDMVLLELWNGARGDNEKKRLGQLEQEMICLPTTSLVWEKARLLARLCRENGLTAPATDLLIIACAGTHEVDIEYQDIHFAAILPLVGEGSSKRNT
ncbi:MAG TPA: PIN domain-containing protein [Gemmatimonadetes bacterium]|nr:PIN domain-containing protein [Gemmatimonadota bacterium]